MEFVFELISELVAQLSGAPNSVLIPFALIAIGYLLRLLPWIPAKFTPLILCIVSIAAFIRMGEPGLVGEVPHPEERLAVVGVIVWLLVWLAHKLVLQYIEDWVVKKVKKFLPQPEQSIQTKGTNNEG